MVGSIGVLYSFLFKVPIREVLAIPDTGPFALGIHLLSLRERGLHGIYS